MTHQPYYPESQARFENDTAGHVMTVLHDDGLYRHVRFKNPEQGMYWFDLITWPGRLTIDGDMGTFTFARVEDMFTFFGGRDINPGYWSEKNRNARDGNVKEFSEDLFRQIVNEHATELADDAFAVDDDEEEDTRKRMDEQRAAFLAAVEFELTGNPDLTSNESAHTALMYFQFQYDELGLLGPTGKKRTIEFSDTWEWDLTDWTTQFLWCCHAIRWGIQKWDASRQEAAA